MEIDGIKFPDSYADRPNLCRVVAELYKSKDTMKAAHMLTAVLAAGALDDALTEERRNLF